MSVPFVSVVIPVYNRAHLLELVLRPLFEQTYPRDRYEVIVVDDGSTDDSATRAEVLGHAWGGNFSVIHQKNMGAGAARNAGIIAAKGDYVACIDSDCEAQSTWLEELVKAASLHQADAVGGPIHTGNIENRVCRYYEAARFHKHKVRQGQVEYLITGNVLFRRQSILAVGQFETGGVVTGEDVDISYRLSHAGFKMAVTDRAPVVHYGDPTTIRQFWHRLRTHGRFSVELAQRWPGSRSIMFQFVRRIGALTLSPYLAVKAARRDSARWFLWFWFCVIIQHTAFITGMVDALARRGQKS